MALIPGLEMNMKSWEEWVSTRPEVVRWAHVFEINVGNWITRFCPACLDDIVKQAKWLRR